MKVSRPPFAFENRLTEGVISAPFFYATKQELFRCGSSAIADDCRGYLQRFRGPVFTEPPVYKKSRKSGIGGPKTPLFHLVKFGPS